MSNFTLCLIAGFEAKRYNAPFNFGLKMLEKVHPWSFPARQIRQERIWTRIARPQGAHHGWCASKAKNAIFAFLHFSITGVIEKSVGNRFSRQPRRGEAQGGAEQKWQYIPIPPQRAF